MDKVSTWVRLPVTALIIALVAAFFVCGLGILNNWQLIDYSNGLFLAGAMAVAIAILSVFGGWGNRADFKQAYSQSAGDMSLFERSKLWTRDMTRGYNAFLLMSLVGALLIGLSALINFFIE